MSSTAKPADGDVAPVDPDKALTLALTKAQADFPVIPKGSTATVPGKNGKQGYSYSYAELGDVLAAVRPVLAENGIATVQRTRHADDGKAILVTELRHVDGGTVDSVIELGQSSANPQAFGGALTYLRRYELVTLCGVAAEEDRDAQDVEPPRTNGQAPAELPHWATPASNAQLAKLGEALVPVLGLERARGVVKTVKGSIGTFPAVLVPTLRHVVGELLELELVVEGGSVREGLLELHRIRETSAADAERQAQDDRAEAPDVDPSAAEGPPAEEEPPASDGSAEDSGPAPGTVKVELPATDDEERSAARAALLEAGCICKDPLGPKEELDDACPIFGHGIPF